MTKADLIEKMAKDAKISKVAAGAVLDSFMANVTKALKKKDGKVTNPGRLWNFSESTPKGTQRPQSANRGSDQN
jgi:nucleoid DNA-binding protein